jgi:periplasmic divalent cation tolerance protein
MANKKTKAPKKLKSAIRLFYVTAPDVTAANRISQTLLNEKLIACSNLLPDMDSRYWWQEKLESAHECVLILKSTSKNSADIMKRVKELHPYEAPCILEIAVETAAKAYGDWLVSQV